MLIALANPDGSFTATLFLSWQGHGAEPGFDRLDSPADVAALFATWFPDVLPLIPDLAGEFLAAPTGQMVTVRTARWDRPTAQGGALLLGDAAHAIVPFFGQGMNCGFEDVSALMAALDKGPTDFASWIADFARHRRADADAIADLALENFVEMRDKVADPQFLLQRGVEGKLIERLGRAYWTRYQLVSFSRIPYRKAKEIGVLQAKVLQGLTAGHTALADIDLDLAEQQARAEILPALQAVGLS
jgi:kynurenine 3-monooxygenase